MYSEEIDRLLKIKNYLLSNEEYFNVCQTSPQISKVSYNSGNQSFHIETKDNYNFNFKVYKKESKK